MGIAMGFIHSINTSGREYFFSLKHVGTLFRRKGQFDFHFG